MTKFLNRIGLYTYFQYNQILSAKQTAENEAVAAKEQVIKMAMEIGKLAKEIDQASIRLSEARTAMANNNLAELIEVIHQLNTESQLLPVTASNVIQFPGNRNG